MELVDCYVTEGPVRSSEHEDSNWVVRFNIDFRRGTRQRTWDHYQVHTIDECNEDERFDEQGNCYPPDEGAGAPPPQKNCPSKYAGNPINITNGNKYQQEVDVQAEKFSLIRHFNSGDRAKGLFGIGWVSDLNSRIEFKTLYSFPKAGSLLAVARSSAIVIDPTGRHYTFEEKEEGLWVYAGSGFATLQSDGANWKFDSGGAVSYHYSKDGRIISQDDGSGEKVAYRYSENGDLRSIEKGVNVLAHITLSGGMVDKIMVGDETYKYSYTGDLLASVSVLDKDQSQMSTKRYLYEDTDFPTVLTGIIDEEGVRSATWIYDDRGRAISSSHANLDTVKIEYLTPLSTKVTNALEKSTIYFFEEKNGVKEIVRVYGEATENCLMSNRRFAYNEGGYVELEVDSNNIATLYSRNERGQILSKKAGMSWIDSNDDDKPSADELSGTLLTKEITTEYHSEFNKPVKITEPGLITEMTYDSAGRLLNTKKTSTTVQ